MTVTKVMGMRGGLWRNVDHQSYRYKWMPEYKPLNYFIFLVNHFATFCCKAVYEYYWLNLKYCTKTQTSSSDVYVLVWLPDVHFRSVNSCHHPPKLGPIQCCCSTEIDQKSSRLMFKSCGFSEHLQHNEAAIPCTFTRSKSHWNHGVYFWSGMPRLVYEVDMHWTYRMSLRCII